MARRVFYSFHYLPDNWRASQVRNIDVLEGNSPVSDNDWEEVTGHGDQAIKRWINHQMERRTCTIVLAGSRTANRKWINYEICRSWERGMGVVGIYIHGLKNRRGEISQMGQNPFDKIRFGDKLFSSVVKCYKPLGRISTERYSWISHNLANIVEEAISIRDHYT